MNEGSFRRHLIERNIIHRTVKNGFVIIEATETKPEIRVYPDTLTWKKFGVLKKYEKVSDRSPNINNFFKMYERSELMK